MARLLFLTRTPDILGLLAEGRRSLIGTGNPFDKYGPGNSPGFNGNYEGVGYGPPSPGNHIEVKDDDRTGQWWWGRLKGIGKEVESHRFKYGAMDKTAIYVFPFGPIVVSRVGGSDSNACAWAVIVRGGLKDEVDYSVGNRLDGWAGTLIFPWAPGWGRLLPR